MAAKKKSGKADPEPTVQVKFDGQPEEFGFFNRFRIGYADGWVTLKLAYASDGSTEPVFSGIGFIDDLARDIESIKTYIGRLGSVHEESFPFDESVRFGPPVSFNHLGMLSSPERGELLIAQFSQRQAFTLSKNKGKDIAGVIHGVYQSNGLTHRRLAYELGDKVS